MSGLGMLCSCSDHGEPEPLPEVLPGAALDTPFPSSPAQLEPELQRPPAPMPPPPSAVLAWLRDVLQWADGLGGAK